MEKVAVKKTAKKAVKKTTPKKKAAVKELSSYAKRYQFIRDELFSLMTDENSDVCPKCAASDIILDAAVFSSNNFYESSGLLADAQFELREVFDEKPH